MYVYVCFYEVVLKWCAYLSIPLSPGQRSSYLAGVSAGSSSLQSPSSSSDLSRCAGMELKHPVTESWVTDIISGDTFLKCFSIWEMHAAVKVCSTLSVFMLWVNSQLCVHPCSSSKPLQNVWLCPSDSDFEMWACPLDPEQAHRVQISVHWPKLNVKVICF